jgi:hypothetical protein
MCFRPFSFLCIVKKILIYGIKNDAIILLDNFYFYLFYLSFKNIFMGRSAEWKKKIKLNKTSTSILIGVAVILVSGFLLKVIADSQSRVDY